MIKSVSGKNFIEVNGGSATTPYININGVGVGNLRYNPTSTNIEVWDGNTWQSFNSAHTYIGLTQTAQNAINWALEKMSKEQQYQKLAEQNAAVKAAVDNLANAQLALDTVVTLAKETY